MSMAVFLESLVYKNSYQLVSYGLVTYDLDWFLTQKFCDGKVQFFS